MLKFKRIIIELETSSGSENDKHSKRYKYTLDKALQAVLELNVESDYSDLSDYSQVFNRCPPSPINFAKNFHPEHSYSTPPAY